MKSFIFASLSTVSNNSLDVLFVVMFALLTIVILLLGVGLLSKFVSKPKVETVSAVQSSKVTIQSTPFNYKAILLVVLAIGFLIRILFVMTIKGAREDINNIFNIMLVSSKSGMSVYYSNSPAVTNPILIYIYSFMGLFTKMFSLSSDSFAMQVLSKLPLIISDIILAIVLYKIAKKYINEYVAVIIAGLVCIFPPFILVSSVWGSVLSIAMLLLVISAYFIVTKNMIGLFITYSLATLTHKDALFIFPIIAVYVVYNFIKAIKYAKANKLSSFSDIMANKNSKNAILIPILFILSMLVMYLISLPIVHSSYYSFFTWFNNMFFKPLTTNQYFGYNALNIYNLFSRNGIEFQSGAVSNVFLIIFALIITLVVLVVYISRKNRATLVLLTAYVIMTLSVFYIGFKELDNILTVGLLLLSFVLIRDKRILKVLFFLSIALILNASFVLANAGYLNNLTDDKFTLGATLLTSGAGLAISIVSSVIAILSEIYFTLVVLDIGLGNKIKPLPVLEKQTIMGSIFNFFKG